MHAIHLADLPHDKVRPVLVLTRDAVREHRRFVTVAPITSRVRGLVSEVLVGPRNGLDHESVVNCDNLATIDKAHLRQQIGTLHADQEAELARAHRRSVRSRLGSALTPISGQRG
ncbi:MAG: type II toxin-antitoxin system PemK/MazF family toxin [Micropruina sp.]|uniref:type II toxin-antitoxin system PemK/MazF family toxin n=1 Tax=Micropruina sp. TaxID=2737536 RepID=UPI0039E32577